MRHIALHEITAANWRATLSLTVQSDQQQIGGDASLTVDN